MNKFLLQLHGPLARYVTFSVAHAPDMPWMFHRHRLQRKLLVRGPGMHPGTWVMHVAWCIPGSLNHSCGENVPSIPGASTNRNFTYLVRGPYIKHPFIVILWNMGNQLLFQWFQILAEVPSHQRQRRHVFGVGVKNTYHEKDNCIIDEFVGILESMGEDMVWGFQLNILYAQFYIGNLWKTFQPYKCSSIRRNKKNHSIISCCHYWICHPFMHIKTPFPSSRETLPCSVPVISGSYDDTYFRTAKFSHQGDDWTRYCFIHSVCSSTIFNKVKDILMLFLLYVYNMWWKIVFMPL